MVFNLQGSEIIFILLLALVVLGPEKLPGAVRRATKTYAELRKMGDSFQSEFRSVLDEPMREMRETATLIKDQADPKKIAETAEREANAAAAAANKAANDVGDTDGAGSDAADGATDAADGSTDSADDTIDTADGSTDAADETTDAADDATDTADGSTDAADETTDAADDTIDTADGSTDAADDATGTAVQTETDDREPAPAQPMVDSLAATLEPGPELEASEPESGAATESESVAATELAPAVDDAPASSSGAPAPVAEFGGAVEQSDDVAGESPGATDDSGHDIWSNSSISAEAGRDDDRMREASQ